MCGTGEATEELIDEAAPAGGEAGRADLQANLEGDSTGDAWSWRVPFKFNFAYASMASRPRHSPRHLPNPFGPPRRSSSTVPLNTSSPIEDAPLRRPVLETCREASNGDESRPYPSPSNPTVVTKHHPHRPWEDESSLNHTYENPYYTRSIDNLLWLPRHPTDILNLDDTVDLRMSLTSQPGAGRLGVWREEDYIESGFSIPFTASIASDEDDANTPHPAFYRRLDGTEQIRLPPMIASRVNTIQQEEDIETAPTYRRQARRQKSSHSGAGSHVEMQRPHTFDIGSSTGYRSLSMGSMSQASSRGPPSGPPSSFVLPSAPHRRNRAASVDHELGLRTTRNFPSMGGRSVLSVVEGATTRPLPFMYPNNSGVSGSKIISIQEAVYGVAIAEEEDAVEDVRDREEEEEEEAQQPKSWLTAWMFRDSS